MTKTSHEAGEETVTACESVALLSEPDLGGDSIHTLEQSFAVSQNTCVFQITKLRIAQIEIDEVIYVLLFRRRKIFPLKHPSVLVAKNCVLHK